MALAITFEATDEFIRHVADDGFGLRLKRTRPFDVASLVLCGALGIVAIVRGSGLLWVLLFLVPSGLGLVTMGVIAWLRRRLRRSIAQQYALLPEPRRITIDLTHEGMRFTNPLESHDVAWADLAAVIEGDTVWYLRLTSGIGIPIPAAAISPEAGGRLVGEIARQREA